MGFTWSLAPWVVMGRSYQVTGPVTFTSPTKLLLSISTWLFFMNACLAVLYDLRET